MYIYAKLKTLKPIFSTTQLLVFLVFIALCNIVTLLQSEKGSSINHQIVSVHQQQHSNLDQCSYLIGIEEENEGDDFIENTSFVNTSARLISFSDFYVQQKNRYLHTIYPRSQPIFIEISTFRIWFQFFNFSFNGKFCHLVFSQNKLKLIQMLQWKIHQ